VSTASTYRPEIDGLRALAVVPVILFHAGFPQVRGGYLGVDIFFVISGYLITRILCQDLASGAFSIFRFYERRARRILPALVVVILFTLPFALLWMPPDAMSSYFRSVIAAATFWSNVHFWQASGYFSPNADEQPLLHTWSLAVEEQFYIVFPLLLWLLWKWRRSLVAMLGGLAVVGLAVALFQTRFDNDVAFYFLHSRAWELLAGAMLAAAERQGFWRPLMHKAIGQGLSLSGALACVVALVFGASHALTPVWPNIAAVLGTLLMIACATPDTLVGRILAWKPLVGIGLVSYSAYLWHHPLFAFARLRSVDEPSLNLMIVLSIASFALAYLTWRYVETPFRRRSFLSRQKVFATAGAVIVVLAASGGVAFESNAKTWRLSPALLEIVEPPLSRVEDCAWRQPVPDAPLINFCAMGLATTENTGVLLWGDSHAGALFDALSAALKARGESGVYFKSHRCLRIPRIVPDGRSNDQDEAACEDVRAALLAYLAQHPPKAIVVSMRWTLRLYPVTGANAVGYDNGEGGIESETPRLNWAKGADGVWTLADKPKQEAMISFLQKLSAIAPLIVVGPVPEVGWHVGNRNFKTVVIQGLPLPDISTSFDRFKTRNAVALAALDEAARTVSLKRVEPAAIFCNSFVPKRCVAQHDGVSYYADDDHVSLAGASKIVEKIMQELPP
jgi:peptidoglycan/LPS O-acetylase OafA/YrhL